jgi:hypothetical protein
MESKDLGSAATVDTLPKNAAGRALNRRNLLTGLSVAGAALGAELIARHFPARPGVVEASTSIPTGFSEVDYLNFLLNLKYLQATFYSYITRGRDLPGTNPLGAVAITGVAATVSTVTITAANSFTAGQTVVVTGLTTASASIAAISATATTVSVTATNGFSAGQAGVVISGLTGALAAYNGTFTLATANATGFTFSFASAGVTGTTVPAGTATASLSLAQYNGTFTIATATSLVFTFALASTLPILSSSVPTGTAVATAPNAPYTINSSVYYAAAGTNAVYDPLSAAPVFTTFTNGAQITDMLNEIYYDELNQLISLQNLINGQIPTAIVSTGAIIRPAMDILGKGATSTTLTTLTPQKALAQARLLEDLSVTAFAGVAQYLTGSNLTAVTQMLAVDGTHAGALRLAIIQWNANNTLANAVIDLVGDSDIVPAAAGAFWQVQADDVAPVDQGTAALAAAGPEVVATPVQFAATQNVTNPCTAPIVGFTVTGSSTTFTSCTPTQYQGFFATAGAATATGSGTKTAYTGPDTPAGFAFARSPSQVLSVLYAATGPGNTPSAPPLPSPATNPLGANSAELQGGFFPSGVGGLINIITS